MIGDLIKISPPQARIAEAKRRKKIPLLRRPWVQWSLLTMLVGSAGCFIGGKMYLSQFEKRAASFDLSQINRMEISTVVHDRGGKEIAELGEEARRPISIDEVPLHFVQALCAAEDGRFFSHKGVDYVGLVRAMWLNVKAMRITQGGSSITQQLARRAFEHVDPSMTALNKERKFTEIFLAHRIEENYSKSQILELYLNRIYLGSSCFGLGAASLKYFNKSVKDLDVLESATICGLIKRPDKYSPLYDIEAAKRNRNQVLQRMVDENFLPQAESDRLKAQPVKISPYLTVRGGSFIVDKVRQEAEPLLERLGYDQVTGQGLHIYTTIDTTLQKQAEESVKRRLAEIEKSKPYAAWVTELNAKNDKKTKARTTYSDYSVAYEDWRRAVRQNPDKPIPKPPPDYLQASIVLMNNRTGEILAIVGGRDYIHNQVNMANRAPGRTPGTAFLPFVYAAAFEDKMFPGTRLNDDPLDNSRIMVGALEGILGEWGREGQTSDFQGKITARAALVQSMNGASARLGLDLGLQKVRDFANRAGVSEVKDVPASILGASEATLESLCLGYSTFANGGERPPATEIIDRITDSHGKLIWKRSAPPMTKVTDAITSFMITDCLRDAMEVGTGAKAADYGLKPIPIAGKTGTHYEFRDLCFAGYTSEVTCAVWVGMRERPETIYPEAFSSTCAMPIWVDLMNAAADVYKPQEFTKPSDLEMVDLCAMSGLRATDRCFEVVQDEDTGRQVFAKTTYKEYLRPGYKLTQSCDVHKSGDIEDVAPEDVPAPPMLLSSQGKGIATGMSAIPIVLKSKTVLGEDPYKSQQPITEVTAVARPAEVGGVQSPSILQSPDLMTKPKIDIPEAPPIKFE
jgi:penicillin-binding protein 1A